MPKADVWLIEIIFRTNGPKFFTLCIGDDTLPIHHTKQLLLCNHIRSIKAAATRAGVTIPDDVDLEIPYATYCLSDALEKIRCHDDDKTATIVDTINLLLDCVRVSDGVLPSRHKEALYGLADHLTFHTSLRAYFDATHRQRAEALDAFLWCIGWLTTHSLVIDN